MQGAVQVCEDQDQEHGYGEGNDHKTNKNHKLFKNKKKHPLYSMARLFVSGLELAVAAAAEVDVHSHSHAHAPCCLFYIGSWQLEAPGTLAINLRC